MSDKIKVALKPEELRIGNYVLKDGKLKGITSFTIIDCRCFPSHFEPIPITPEILERIGFTHVHLGGQSMIMKDDPYGTKSYTVTQNTDTSGGYWCFIVTDFAPNSKIGTDTVFIKRDMRYLHELQNLFYAIHASELKYGKERS